jgi:hypothetical protein
VRRFALPVIAALALAGGALADDAATAKKAQKQATELLKKLAAADDPGKRDEIGAELDKVDIRGRIPAYIEGLRASRAAVQRAAVARLRGLKIAELSPHLVVLATGEAERPVRDDAHAAAVALDADYARRWYEHLAARDFGGRRLLAIERLGEIASPASVPLLATVVETVGLEVHVQVAKLRGFHVVPVRLGQGAGGANTHIPVALPTVDLVDAHFNAPIPAPVQSRWKDASLAALRSIAGEDLGPDPERWRAWYRDHKDDPPRPR